MLRQLYDPLVIEGADGEPIPFLLESFSSNDDYTEWTFTLRPGITFHDGSPVNSAALIRHLEELGNATLSRLAFEEAEIQSFDVFIAVNHSGYSLAMERFWWHSGYSPPPPVPAVNFGRIADDRIDAALDEVITTDDEDRQRELAEEVNRAFAEGVYNIWLYHSRWLIAAHDYVNGVDNLTLPDGGEHPRVFLGRVFLAETWLDER